MRALLAKIPSSYRYVVIDTPPVLAASESMVLSRAADATLICAMKDISRVDQVARTYERLLAAGSNPVGTVLNGVPTKQYAYRYGAYGYTLD
jgi:tyrosine-protein kinase Etk/Wzc